MPAEIVGVEELLDALKGIKKDQLWKRPFHQRTAAFLHEEADKRVPVASGRLKKSGRESVQKGAGVVRYGRKRIPWAEPAHFGHFNRPQGGSIRAYNYLLGPAEDKDAELGEVADEELDEYFREVGLA